MSLRLSFFRSETYFYQNRNFHLKRWCSLRNRLINLNLTPAIKNFWELRKEALHFFSVFFFLSHLQWLHLSSSFFQNENSRANIRTNIVLLSFEILHIRFLILCKRKRLHSMKLRRECPECPAIDNRLDFTQWFNPCREYD